MYSKVFISGIAIATLSVLLPVTVNGADNPPKPEPAPTSDTPRFSCQVQNGQYMVMYQPKSQPGKSFPWAVPSAMGGGWSPERRCYEISRRLEAYRPDGLLEMRTAIENGYNIICATTEKNPTCRIVLTVPPGQDPIVTRDRVFANITTADSGQQTTGVATFKEGSSLPDVLGLPVSLPLPRSRDTIYLKPFLDPTDGGTLTAVPVPRLNPNNFR